MRSSASGSLRVMNLIEAFEAIGSARSCSSPFSSIATAFFSSDLATDAATSRPVVPGSYWRSAPSGNVKGDHWPLLLTPADRAGKRRLREPACAVQRTCPSRALSFFADPPKFAECQRRAWDSLRDRIIAARAEGVAAEHPKKPKQEPPPGAVSADGLHGVVRAAGHMPAMTPKEHREAQLVDPDEPKQ